MQQDFTWDAEITPLVRTEFDKQCRTSYKNHVHEWKKIWLAGKGKIPKNCGEDRFREFIQYWTKDDTKKIASTNSTNRNSNRGGLGIATHNNGAQTFERRAQVLTEKFGEEPNFLVLLEDTHTNKKTKVIQDKKAISVIESVKKKTDDILTQRSQEGSSGSNELSRDEIDHLVIETTPSTRGRVFGLGNLASSSGGLSQLRPRNLSATEREELLMLRSKSEEMERKQRELETKQREQVEEMERKQQELETKQRAHAEEMERKQKELETKQRAQEEEMAKFRDMFSAYSQMFSDTQPGPG